MATITTTRTRPAVGALSAGLALTVLTTAVPWIDRATSGALAAHYQAGYPELSAAKIDEVVTTWLAILTGIGALGVVCWLVTIRAAAAGRSWARWAAATLAPRANVAAFLLTVRENTGDVALPPLIGWTGVIPSLAGLAAVVLLWRRPAPRPAA